VRLTEFEIKSIIESFRNYFETGDIYLFGSRVDDAQKGGDIDLYIDTQDSDGLFEKKLQMLRDIKVKIGEQKIDVVISSDKERAIEEEALKKGVKLDMKKLKQEKVINECEKHLQRLKYAKSELEDIFPLTQKSYQNLSQEDIQAIDQFIYRFSKLQDTIGEKLIKIVFSLYEENIEKFTFIDILNRLEKAEILTTQAWKELRDIRNELSHHYEDESLESSIVLNKVYEKEEFLESIYQNIKNTLNKG
jgi:predicted nucleotidyltransferase